MRKNLMVEHLESIGFDGQKTIATYFGQYGNCVRFNEDGDEYFNVGILSERINIGTCIEVIRRHHQIDIYTVNETWHVQLFDLQDCPNDIGVSCVAEFGYGENELVDVLFDCVTWIINEQVSA